MNIVWFICKMFGALTFGLIILFLLFTIIINIIVRWGGYKDDE